MTVGPGPTGPEAPGAALRARLEPVQARSQRSQRAILDAAHALLKIHGVQGLTTAAVAEASGASVGAVYRLFPNKESIVCRLYEEKLNEIRRRGDAWRSDDPGPGPWRAFFDGYFHALKVAEREVDFDFSLVNAMQTLPQLWRIDLLHGVVLADQVAMDMRRLGSPWSDAALFDLAMTLYALDSATWMSWRFAQRYPSLTIDRMIEASLHMMRPAMEGEAEPRDLSISREQLLRRPPAI